MRSYLSEDKYISQVFDNPSSSDSVPVTLDYTDEVRVIKIMLIITNHDGNVIGKTNKVRLKISPTGEGGTHIDPREELDEIIAELRAKNAAQAETITTQDETISQQTEQITELNDEVSTLEGTVAEQRATITRQNTTIDELNERRTPVYIPAQLEPKLITPKDTTEYYSPSEGREENNTLVAELNRKEKIIRELQVYKDTLINILSQNNVENKDVVIPEGVTELRNSSFSTAENTTGSFQSEKTYHIVSIPESVTKIGGCCFYGCTLLNEILDLSNTNIQEVKSNAFVHCRGLKKIIFPLNCELNDVKLLRGSDVEEVELKGSRHYSSWSPCFSEANKLKTVVFAGYTFDTLTDYAFFGCSDLEHLELPYGVKSIGYQCFSNVGSNSNVILVFPNSITSFKGSFIYLGEKRYYKKITLDLSSYTDPNNIPQLAGSIGLLNSQTNHHQIIVANEVMRTAFSSATNWSAYADIMYTVNEVNSN